MGSNAQARYRHHWLWPCAMPLVGLWISYRDVLSSGFRRMAGDFGDSRLVNYILEHSYLWCRGERLHRSFWDSPHFYPTPNVSAYTDTILTAAPLYWGFRALGFVPDTASQLWVLTLLLANFAAFHLFLRKAFYFDHMSSAFGAALYAFSAARTAQLNHQQLLPQFFMILAFFALIRVFRRMDSRSGRVQEKPRTQRWIVIFFATSTAQLYASFYLGWFLFLGVSSALVIALIVEPWRRELMATLRENAVWIAGSAVASVAVLYPLIIHSIAAAASVVGLRGYSAIEPMIPTWAAWTYLGTDSWFYGPLANVGTWRAVTDSEYVHELKLGLGFVTTTIVLWGLWTERKTTRIVLFALSALVIILCVTRLTPSVVLWSLLARVVPGAFAVRAISRVVLLLLIPAGIGLAACLHRRRSLAVAALFGFVCLGEQLRDLQTFDKLAIRADVAAVADQVDAARCGYFFLSPRDPTVFVNWKSHLDAMWAGIEKGVPTVNGVSGYLPPGWDLRLWDNVIRNSQDERELDFALRSWMRVSGLDPARLCWVR